jgi:hypothetical protein
LLTKLENSERTEFLFAFKIFISCSQTESVNETDRQADMERQTVQYSYRCEIFVATFHVFVSLAYIALGFIKKKQQYAPILYSVY